MCRNRPTLRPLAAGALAVVLGLGSAGCGGDGSGGPSDAAKVAMLKTRVDGATRSLAPRLARSVEGELPSVGATYADCRAGTGVRYSSLGSLLSPGPDPAAAGRALRSALSAAGYDVEDGPSRGSTIGRRKGLQVVVDGEARTPLGVLHYVSIETGCVQVSSRAREDALAVPDEDFGRITGSS